MNDHFFHIWNVCTNTRVLTWSIRMVFWQFMGIGPIAIFSVHILIGMVSSKQVIMNTNMQLLSWNNTNIILIITNLLICCTISVKIMIVRKWLPIIHLHERYMLVGMSTTSRHVMSGKILFLK